MAEGLGVDATSVSRELRRNRCAQIRFQIYVLLERHDCAHVVALDWLEGLLGEPEASAGSSGSS